MIINHNLLWKVVNEGKFHLRAPHEILYRNDLYNYLYDIDSRLSPEGRIYMPVIKCALVVPYEGEVRLGNAALGQAAMSATVKMKLYNASLTIQDSMTSASTFATHEAAFTGYAEKAINNANWTTTTVSTVTTSVYAAQTFTLTSGSAEDEYGYLFTDSSTLSSAKCLWAEQFPGAPYHLANANDAITITPQITWA